MTEPTQQSLPVMSDSQKMLALALALKAIDDAYEELADFKATIKARIETLLKESRAIRYEILSGQGALPLEPAPEKQIDAVLERVAEQVNSGSLDTPGVTCTAEVRPAVDETSAEERVRTRAAKRRKKLLGPDAPPDKRTAFPHGANENA